jgi:hypothetical protein
MSAGTHSLVVLDNGQGATFVLAACETNQAAEAKARLFQTDLLAMDFDEWSERYDIPSGFLDRRRDRGELEKFIAGFRRSR